MFWFTSPVMGLPNCTSVLTSVELMFSYVGDDGMRMVSTDGLSTLLMFAWVLSFSKSDGVLHPLMMSPMLFSEQKSATSPDVEQSTTRPAEMRS